jgi:hypothetical protein
MKKIKASLLRHPDFAVFTNSKTYKMLHGMIECEKE